MKYLVHLTAPITTTIGADCLRGEPRWERSVLDALLSSGRQVHTTKRIWTSEETPPDNLHDGINPEWQDDSVLITYGVPQNMHIAAKAKYYIVQMLDEPQEHIIKEFNQHLEERPNSIVATCGFKSWVYLSRIQKAFGAANVEFVQGPTVPYVVEDADHFNAPILLWSYRNFWAYSKKDPKGMERLFNKVESFLSRDPALKLVITLGAYAPEELPNPLTGGRKWVFSQPFMSQMKKFADRIEVVSELHWYEMLNLFSQTRLVISPPEPLGCPPYEAAMYGVPTILSKDNNPFLNSDKSPFFPEVLTAPGRISDEFTTYLERLFTDHSFYRARGDAYRKYVGANATYESYVRQLDALTKKRGWE